MSWRWLVNGLGGLVGMMLNTFAEHPEQKIDEEHHAKLVKLVERLENLRDQLAERK